MKAPAAAGGGSRSYGCDVGGLLRYLYGPGKANEHENPHLIGAWDGAAHLLEPPVHARGGGRTSVSVSALAGRLTDPVLWNPKLTMSDPHVYHLTLSTGPADRHLTDQEWADVAGDMMDRVGIAPAGDPAGCRWVGVRHGVSKDGNDHIHVVATLARQDGTLPRIRGDYVALREGAREWEQRLGLTVTAAAGEASSLSQPAQGERPKARRMAGADLTEEGRAVANKVRAAAARSSNDEQFFAILKANGLTVHRRVERGGGNVRGYGVSTGSGRWTGSDLNGQSLPRLRRMWLSSTPGTERDKLAELTPPGPENTRTFLSRAVRMAANEATNQSEFFQRLRAYGLVVHSRISTTNATEVTGYAVGVAGQTDAAGRTVTYSGSSLSGQSLPRLRQGWSARPHTGTPAEEMSTERIAGKLAAGAKIIGNNPDPGTHEGAAAAAGVALHSLAVGAEGAGGGPLTRIAEQFNHATDPISPPTYGGGTSGLLQASRALYALKGGTKDRTQQQIMEILAAAMGLAVALERRRGQQGHPSQQAAAAQTGTLIARHYDTLRASVAVAAASTLSPEVQSKDCPAELATRGAFPKPFDASAAAAAAIRSQGIENPLATRSPGKNTPIQRKGPTL